MSGEFKLLQKSKILVTGANGFLGRHVVKTLEDIGVERRNIFTFRSSEYDLRIQKEAFSVVERYEPDIVLNLAARLGGIGDNRKFPAFYFYDNLQIGINAIEASRLLGVKKLVNIGTVCSYPKNTAVPFKEEDLWNGFPEETNGPYGVSKRATIVYSLAVEKQYNFKTINLVLTNLFGPGDDFRESTSHVIPAIIKKVIKARDENKSFIEAWGDGSPSRDFLYITDAAKAVVLAAENCNVCEPVNVGSGQEVCIRDVVNSIVEMVEFKGEVRWNTEMPNGQPRRVLDTSKAKEYFSFSAVKNFEVGLREIYDWYIANRNHIDGLSDKFKDVIPNQEFRCQFAEKNV